MLALARALAGKQRRSDSLGCGYASELIRQDGSDQLRASFVSTGLHRRQARQALNQWIVNRPLGVGAGVTEPTDGHHNQVRCHLAQCVLTQSHPVDHTGAEILHKHIGGSHQL